MKKLFEKAYEGKRVLVTGHTGFKGSWLSIWLRSLGAHVIGYALEPNTTPSLFKAAQLESKLDHYAKDVRNFSDLLTVVKKTRPEIVFHMAAQPLVRASYQSPRETYETNVMGTVNLLEVLRQVGGVRSTVIITSDKCYENREIDYAYKEEDPMGGFDPYSSSKGAAELVVQAYRRSFLSQEGLASARAGNVVGGGDWAEDRILPDCIRALVSKEPVFVRNPQAIRPWQHVLEPLSGYLWLGAQLLKNPKKFSGPWNFGPNPEGNVTVRQVVELVLKEWGSGQWTSPPKKPDEKTVHEAHLLKLDCTKAQNLLSWKPVYSIAECLRESTNWYQAFYLEQNKDMEAFTREQIDRYVQKASGKDDPPSWVL
ncbi:MAG: CDP-glucose 4,6-dehydratase [bacterium]|nr:CDP-glucose 4,6-dehydratase [bacterium]